MREILPIESIKERDIDLVLLEELNVNHQFCEWFIQSVGLPEITAHEGAWRSITAYGKGETDILFSYHANDEKVYVLIENKLDAYFQHEQSKRYDSRASTYCEDGSCTVAFTVLVAPRQYCENQHDFEQYVTYESIGEFLRSTGGDRGIFKNHLLDIAIHKLRRGFQAVNSPIVQEFWMTYWLYRSSNYPMLEMKRPEIVPDGSDWPVLKLDRLPGVSFYHKLDQGNIDAIIVGINQESMSILKDLFPKDTIVKYSGTRMSIKIESPRIDRHKDFHSQSISVDKGLKVIQDLAELIVNANIKMFNNEMC